MKKESFKVRGYEVSHAKFDGGDDLKQVLGADRLLSIVNSYLSAHEWNSNFERALVAKAEAAGHVREVEKNAEGKIVNTETYSSFLKRTGFTLKPHEAQALADTIAFPPVVNAREAKVDKDLVERLELARKLLDTPERLESFRKRVAAAETFEGGQIEWPDFNGETTEEQDIANLAEVIRLFRLAI